LWSNKLEYLLKHAASADFVFPLGEQEASFKVGSFSGWHEAQLRIFNYCRTLRNIDKDRLLDRLAGHLKVRVPAEATEDFSSLTWEQIREMHAHGVEFGSHSCSHPICSRLSDEELMSELRTSKQEIEKNLSEPVEVFCFPNGQPEDFSDDVIRLVKNAGYRAAVTTVCGFNGLKGTDPFRLKRISLSTIDRAVLYRSLTRTDRAR
jgi:peptidoglycan/xylan/chitin deacetylase (PgdA/CDA1 family)